MKAGRLQPEGRIVLAGTGPLVLLLADQLRRLGIRPALVARTDRFRDKVTALKKLRLAAVPALLKGLGWIVRLRLAGVPMQTGISGLQAHGYGRVESVSLDGSGGRIDVPCDLLIVHDGVVPSIDLAHCAGLALEWQETDTSWRPKTSEDGRADLAPGPALTPGPCRVHVTGDARGIGGADAAVAHGRLVAQAVLAALEGVGAIDKRSRARTATRRAMAARPFIDAAFPPGLAAQRPDDETIVCRCEEISAATLRASIREGATDMNLLRGLLRCGMGPCQGRSCAVSVARLLAEANTQPSPPPVPFRARPPARPIPLGALAAMTGLDPVLAQVVSLDDKPGTAAEDDAHA